MALDVELINLKSAGTYRFERDKSEVSNGEQTPISNLRLVVGFSKTGPFNTVRLVTSTAQFIKLYGNIDRSLEKKGSYFHRSALVALSAGPILCLNLLTLDPDRDQVIEKSFSTNSSDVNKLSVTLPLQALYNTDKMWFASEDAYLEAVNNYFAPKSFTPEPEADAFDKKWSDGILHITNVGKKPVSVLIKKASDYSSKGYKLTLNEWYGEGNVPEYLNGTSYVSDYLVEVYVVGGNFGPQLDSGERIVSSFDLDGDAAEGQVGDILYAYGISEFPYKRFSSDIVYQSYFDADGFIRGTNDANLYKFLNLPSVDVRAKYIGSLIPNFVDKLGKNIWIQKLINDDIDTIGVLCTENVSLLEDVNLDADFIDEKIDIIGHGVYGRILGENDEYILPEDGLSFDFLGYKFNYKDKPQVIKVGEDHFEKELSANAEATDEETDYPFVWKRVKAADDEEDVYLYSSSSYVTVGQKVYMKSGSDSDFDELDVDEIIDDVKPLVTEFVGLSSADLYLDAKNTKAYIARDNEAVLALGSNVNVDDYLLSDFYTDENGKNHSRITRVVEVKYVYGNDGKKAGVLVICSDKISKTRGENDNIIVKITPIDKLAERLHWVCLPGFQISKESMPDGTNERQNEILDMLRETPEYLKDSMPSSIFKALIDKDYIQWRYLIDTFGLGIEEECKKVYTQICKTRTSGFAIINAPSQLDFKKSADPSFTNRIGGVEAEFIASGGDRSKNPSFLFTLPKIENGASWGAYYYPYLRITDLGAAKSVPPAAYVSNLYIQKYSRGFAWSIVAGQKRGVISGNQVVGVEATLVAENRDWLEPMGLNPIIWEPGVGVEVYANKTAKQTPVSALSSAHVREAAIFIQDNIETILRKYVFEFNTAQTRMEIKTLVDEFLETMKNNGGLYDYKTVMDTTNNTAEVIDNNKGVIDVYVEIVRGLEIIAQRLTILKTGAIAAGGFE